MDKRRIDTARGTSLFEALLVVLFLTVLSVGLLQLLTQSLAVYTRVQSHRKSAIEVWNQTRAARASRPPDASFFYPCPTCRPLYSWSVEAPDKQDWEVLCAEK
jgi:Tfp pilus assembly protein PilV